jgi:hypothetical protein
MHIIIPLPDRPVLMESKLHQRICRHHRHQHLKSSKKCKRYDLEIF